MSIRTCARIVVRRGRGKKKKKRKKKKKKKDPGVHGHTRFRCIALVIDDCRPSLEEVPFGARRSKGDAGD